MYFVCELKLWSYSQTNDFSVTNWAVKSSKTADPKKYSCCRCGSGFNVSSTFSISDGGGFGKNVIAFGVDNSSSTHDNNIKIYLNYW